MKNGRNDPCPCGSGKKRKHCCSGKAALQAAVAPPNIHTTLQSALAHHRSGRLPEAEAGYRRILEREPKQPDALHYLGVIHHQRGEWVRAAELIRQAIAINPAAAAYHANLGSALTRLGEPEAALASFDRAIELNPALPDAHYNRGNTLRDLGQSAAAIAGYRRALALKPDFAQAACNLASLMQRLGDFDAAIATYRQTLRQAPTHVPAHFGLADACREAGQPAEAMAAYRQTLALQPDHAQAHNNLGALLMQTGRPAEAAACLRAAVAIDPAYADAHANLGGALHKLGDIPGALAAFEQALRLKPGLDNVRHLAAALSGQTTERPPAQYIEKLFDGYAGKFDLHLTQELGYKMPRELVALLGCSAALPAGQWDVLDLGCGTGLSGLAMSPHARHLSGVDLSAKMLEKARARNIYQRLEHADLLPMMRGEATASYDAIIAADVFVYLGMLDDVVAEARRLLRPGGYFMFSVEALDALAGATAVLESSPGYTLNPSGRYAHSAGYLQKLATANSYQPLAMISTPVRFEKGAPIAAWAAVWQG